MKSPFGVEPITEVFLPQAPLVYVVTQLRFPLMSQLADEQGVQPFAAALKAEYPVLHREQSVGLLISAEGAVQQPTQDVIWRLQDLPGVWQVTVSPTWVALTTSRITSSDELCSRLQVVLEACVATFGPPIAERIGVRYVDRIDTPDQLARLNELVRPELLGGWAIPTDDKTELQHSFTETVFARGGHQMLARWGVVPPGAVPDPQIERSPNQAWILDLDVAADGRFAFDPAKLTKTVRSYSDDIYRFFRWAVTDQFITEAGGELDDGS